MTNEEKMLDRLANWRRVYGDRRARAVSSTYIACRYAEATHNRLPETDEEREKREQEELENREPPEPCPDFKDADLLTEVWQVMPDFVGYLPVKKNIKVLAFGTARDLERTLRKSQVFTREDFINWREKNFKAFFERVENEEALRKKLDY